MRAKSKSSLDFESYQRGWNHSTPPIDFARLHSRFSLPVSWTRWWVNQIGSEAEAMTVHVTVVARAALRTVR